jgi:uncharacterized protein
MAQDLQVQVAELRLPLLSSRAVDRSVVRRRVVRSWWLLRHTLPYASFAWKLHFTQAGRTLRRHSGVFDRKFLGPYLSVELDARRKLTIQESLVDFLNAHFRPALLARIVSEGAILWQRTGQDEDHQILLRLADASKFEGDLALEYLFNGKRLHRLSFVFSPGSPFHLTDGMIAFVGGSQGNNGGQNETRAAARSNSSLHPSNMLLLALRAICQSLGIDALCGVASRYQLLNHSMEGPRPENYDLLWSANGGRSHGHFFYMNSKLDFADDEQLTGTHRTRRRRRRRMRQELVDAITNDLAGHLNRQSR